PTQRQSLQTRMQQLTKNDRLITICKRPDPESNDPTGVAPPPGIEQSEVGFSDFLQDRDGVVRRHLLFGSSNTIAKCSTPYGLSVQLAFRYLFRQQPPITPSFTSDQHLQLGNVIFPSLSNPTGGYQRFDSRGGQVLLNYRSTNEIAQQVTVEQLLSNDMNLDAIRDRIVLIGLTAPSSGDFFATPYGRSFPQRLPGVVVHAHMVSQILSAVLDQRSLLWVWSAPLETLWIAGWALLGGLIVWRFRRLNAILLATGISLVLLSGCCWLILTRSGWIPLIPATFGIVLNTSFVAYRFNSLTKSNLKTLQGE
ncbi:CHASE2 domain-containing protein, partial [Pseudanabaenaceae cyanobacterium LEGE 13415]|nr:CHASE2 domain-containing protein [Pseudanabaenaceae cyanobacterium LEGE 13415]